MQKSLDQMNVRVHRAVSELNGVTGMAIVRAIAAGERDAQKLAQLRDRRCRQSEQEIAEQLSGTGEKITCLACDRVCRCTTPLQSGLLPRSRRSYGS
jgi:hypothetical protein